MKATCLQESMHRTLQITSRVTPARTALPITQNTLIQADGQMLRLTATNLDMTVRMSLPATIEQEGALAVPNKLLSEFVSTLSRDTMEMEQPEGTTMLKLKCGAAKANINSASADLFPPTPEFERNVSITLGVAEFRKAIARVAFCAASDNGRPVLTGVLMDINEDKLVTAGADGFRLGVQHTPGDNASGEGARIVVPARIANEVQRMANNNGDNVEIIVPSNEKYVRFRIGSEEPQSSDIEVTATLLDGSFPNYEALIPDELPNHAVFTVSDLQGAVRRAGLFAKDDHNTVRVEMLKENGKGRAIISSESKELGNNRAELEIKEIVGTGVEIALNNRFMQDLLGSLGSKDIRLEVQNHTTPAKMVIPLEDDYVHVMMPIVTLDNQ